MSNQFEPELGQAAFGCSYSEYECPEFIEAGLNYLAEEIERVEWNITQKQYEAPTRNNGGEYKTDIFEMRAYCWKECNCGFEKKEWEFNEKHSDDCYQSELLKEEIKAGKFYNEKFDMYDWPKEWDFNKRSNIEKKIYEKLTKKYNLSMLGCAIHCTCDLGERYAKWLKEIGYPNGHKNDCCTVLPNFKHKSGFEVQWYKYCGRGMSMNKPIDANEFFKIIDECIESVREKDKKYD